LRKSRAADWFGVDESRIWRRIDCGRRFDGTRRREQPRLEVYRRPGNRLPIAL